MFTLIAYLLFCSSSEKIDGAETEIPMASIEEVHVGSEDWASSQWATSVAPFATQEESPAIDTETLTETYGTTPHFRSLTRSPASLLIFYRGKSIRIRTAEAASAAAIAAYLREHIQHRTGQEENSM